MFPLFVFVRDGIVELVGELHVLHRKLAHRLEVWMPGGLHQHEGGGLGQGTVAKCLGFDGKVALL